MEEHTINTSMFREILQIDKNLIRKVSLEFELDESPVLIVTVKQEEIDQKKMDITALTNLLLSLTAKKSQTEPILIALEDRLIEILCVHNQSTLNYRIEVQLEPYEDLYLEDEFEEENHQRLVQKCRDIPKYTDISEKKKGMDTDVEKTQKR